MTFIIGFICSLVLAAFIVIWIIYCMFFKEKHKSEVHQYNITELRRKNYEIAQAQEQEGVKKEVVAGIFMLPRKKGNDEQNYDKRPDYPEGTINFQPRTEKLIEIFDDSTLEVDKRPCGAFDVDVNLPYHSDV